MLIVIDTNIIIRDHHLEGAAFRSLLDSAKSVGATLCVPRCVLDEAQEHFEQALRGAAGQLDNAAKSFARLLQRDADPTTPVEDFAAEAAKYRASLEKRFKAAGGRSLDYPSFSSEEVIQRAAKHKKPFAAKGDQGFKDYLIWKSVIALAKESKTQVKLVTTNSGDFGDGHGGLHADLLADLDVSGVPHDRILLRESLDTILTAFIMPALQEVKEIQQQLKDGTFEALNLDSWLDANLAESIDIDRVQDLRWAIRREFENPTIDGISSVNAVEVTDVRKLPSGEFLIEVEVDVEAEVGFYIFKGDYYPIEEEVSAVSWNEHYMTGTTYVAMFVRLLLTFDPKEEDVTSWDVVEASALSATGGE